jgi:DNA polymerase I-like protein with 3'-5' exonuclease and polymerase domains
MIPSANGALPSDVRAAAAYYLERGYVPVPIPRTGGGKAPVLERWQHLRPAPDDLDRLFPSHQALNLGLLLGAPSGGLIDIDLDCPEAVAAAPFLLPPTEMVSGRAGRPRSHWWFRVEQPPDRAADEYRDVDADRSMLLELRSTRGQTVVPPSVHESGESVVWYSHGQPARVGLGELQAAARAVAAAALLARSWPGKNSRQTCFLALSGALLRAGWPVERVERFAAAVAAATGDDEARKRVQTVAHTAGKLEENKPATGWPKLEELLGPAGLGVVRQVRQWLGLGPAAAPGGASAGPRKVPVRAIAPYLPFPVDALPAPLAAYVRQVALALGCDAAYAALPVLAVVASAIGNTRVIRLKRGWEEPSVVWAAIIGDSGTLKSPAYLKAVAHLFRLQKQLLQKFKEAMAQFEEELAQWEAEKKKRDGEPGEKPQPPILPRVVCSDTTIEKLAEILEDNERGTLAARDELAAWLASFTRYKGRQGGSDLPNWLELHRAGTIVVDRKTGERRTLFVSRAAVSVTGGIQPGVLARTLTPEFLDAGLAARVLMAMPPKLPKRWSEAEIDPGVEQAYQATLDKLLRLEFDTDGGERVPHVLPLSRDAKAVWVAFYNDWAGEQAAAEGEQAAAFSKLEGYAARFALLHHVVSHRAVDADDVRAVGARSVEAGIALARWFAGEARRLYTTLSESAEERETRRLVEFIRARGGQISVKELQRSNARKYPTAPAAEAALDALVEGRLARWEDRTATDRGGRPTRDCCLISAQAPDETDETPREGADSGPEGPIEPSDETPLASNDTPEKQGDLGVSSVSSDVGFNDSAGRAGPGPGPAADGGFVGQGEVSSGASQSPAGSPGGIVTARPAPPYLLVADAAGVEMVKAALDQTELVGLDVETTGLDPRNDRARLLAVATDTVEGGSFVYVVDCFAVNPSPLWDALAGKELVCHNARFDLQFLARMGFAPTGRVHDTMLLAQLLTAGTGERVSLEACCRRYLRVDLDKALQKSDWSAALTDAQLAYAARDVDVLGPLYRDLVARIRDAGLEGVAELEERCLRAVVWLSQSGVAIDRDAWSAQAEGAVRDADRLRAALNEAAPPPTDGQLFDGTWNWDSPMQVRQAFDVLGIRLGESSDDAALAAVDHPVARLLREYRAARKHTSVYGTGWLKHVAEDGRVYADWRQIGTVVGRMSCSSPNLNQLPRGAVRRRVVAPPGRALVKADWSQLHLRIIAGVAPEPAMQAAFREGQDLHTLTARRLTGKEEVTKEERQRAKAAAFGLCYGMGAKRFRAYARADYGIDLSLAEAEALRRAFFRAYPGLRVWHRRQRDGVVTLRSPSGRICREVTKFSDKLANSILLIEADCLKKALGLLWERRGECPDAFPVLACHDEVVVECDRVQAELAEKWLIRCMLEAAVPLLGPVPVEVTASIGASWGGGEIREERRAQLPSAGD